jgi:hypothetical protein
MGISLSRVLITWPCTAVGWITWAVGLLWEPFAALGLLLLFLVWTGWRKHVCRRPAAPPPRSVQAKLTFPGTELGCVGLLARDFRVIESPDQHGLSHVEFGQLIGPRPVLTAFFQEYGDLSRVNDHRLHVEQEGGQASDWELPVVVSVGQAHSAGGLIICDRVSLMARELA